MAGGDGRDDQGCPECQAVLIQSEPRFSRWCRACDWNVDPLEQAQRPPGRLARLRHRIEDRLAESLYAELATRPIDRPGVDAAAVAAVVLAAVVLLVPFGLVALAGWLVVVARDNPFAWAAGVVLAGLAVVMRPRVARLDRGVHRLTREAAPRLYDLVDRMCEELGAPRVHQIVVGGAFNAAAGVVGWRRRRTLLIGLQVWNVLSRQQRVAVLGHELGHFVNGDPTHRGVVGSALESLARLEGVFRGDGGPLIPIHDGLLTMLEAVAQVVMWVLSLPVRAVLYAVGFLTFRSGQRAEYLADHLASRLGGTDANLSALEIQLLGGSIHRHLATQVTRAGKPDLWEAERRYVAEFPALEKERLRRAAARERSRADRTHPPTQLRMKLAAIPARRMSAALVLDLGEAEAIERELSPWYDKLEKELRDELLRAKYL